MRSTTCVRLPAASMIRRARIVALVCLIASATSAAPPRASALTFTFTPGAGLQALQSGTAAQQQTAASVLADVQTAANTWAAEFTDPVTVNLTIDWGSPSAGSLADTQPAYSAYPYSTVRAALQNDITTPADSMAVNNLPSGSSINFYTTDRQGNLVFDNNGSTNNTTINVNSADAKALGLIAGNAAAQDATITFASTQPWDFDHGATINSAEYDFVSVATHEIGHALGFGSGVDAIDESFGAGPLASLPPTITQDGLTVYTVLDLFRHSTYADTHQSSSTLDLSVGGSPFFSLDGTTNLGLFSTGHYNGDGQEAGHWKDNLGLGIMDPTFAKGERGVVTALDITSLDVVGWDPRAVPEPSTVVLTLIGVAAVAVRRWRNR